MSDRPKLRLIRGGKASPPPRPICVHRGWRIAPGDGLDGGSGPGHFVCRSRSRREALGVVAADLALAKLLGPISAAIPSVRARVLEVLDQPGVPSATLLLELLEHAVERATDTDERRRALALALIRSRRARLADPGQHAL